MRRFYLIAIVSISMMSLSYGGSLSNGEWKPMGCGEKPAKPIIQDTNAEAFNKSVADINVWQQNNQEYLQCLINEANADNSLIANSANKAQADFRQDIESISSEANEIKKKLDKAK